WFDELALSGGSAFFSRHSRRDAEMPEMSSADLPALLDLFAAQGITVWLDGGWGVDALLGTQTRTHKDVDIVIALDEVPQLQNVLGDQGFAVHDGIVPHSF